MAKRDEAFWIKLSQEAGLDDAAQKLLLQAVKNEKFEKGLYDSLVPREESMRHLEDARKSKEEADAAKAQAIENYQKNLQWYQTNASRLTQSEEYAKRVQAYEALYGPLGGDPANPNPAASPNGKDQPKYLTAEELATAQRNYWTLQRQLRRAEQSYRKTFGEDLPDEALDELEKIAQKPENSSRSFTDMYSEWVGPKLEAHRSADIEARVKKAREEAYNEGLAKGRMHEPSTAAPEEISPLYLARPKKEDIPDERTVMNNFIAGLEAPAGASR